MVDHVKCRSPNEPKSLIEVTYVALLNIEAQRFNVNLFSYPYRVTTPSYTFWGNLGDQVKVRSPKKAKIVDRGSVCISSERTCCKLQYEPYPISVACS